MPLKRDWWVMQNIVKESWELKEREAASEENDRRGQPRSSAGNKSHESQPFEALSSTALNSDTTANYQCDPEHLPKYPVPLSSQPLHRPCSYTVAVIIEASPCPEGYQSQFVVPGTLPTLPGASAPTFSEIPGGKGATRGSVWGLVKSVPQERNLRQVQGQEGWRAEGGQRRKKEVTHNFSQLQKCPSEGKIFELICG